MNPTNKKILLAAALLAPLLLLPTTMTNNFANKSLPRGLRNNNPGNLRKTSVAWRGKVENPLDTAFESFSSMSYGIRSAVQNAFTQWNRGKTTIRTLITIWAPPSENNTALYVATVAKAAKIGADARIVWENHALVADIMYAIFLHENGPVAAKYITKADVLAQINSLWPDPKAA